MAAIAFAIFAELSAPGILSAKIVTVSRLFRLARLVIPLTSVFEIVATERFDPAEVCFTNCFAPPVVDKSEPVPP
jgi:hypothetical protein